MPRQSFDALDPAVELAFERCLARYARQGAQINDVAMKFLAQWDEMAADGGLIATEAWRQYRERLDTLRDWLDAALVARPERGSRIADARYRQLPNAREAWREEFIRLAAPFDALVVPTVSLTALRLSDLGKTDAARQRDNARVTRNPVIISFLDACAITLSCQEVGAPPMGIAFVGASMRDARVLGAALSLESATSGQSAV